MAQTKVEVRIVSGSLKGRKLVAMVHDKLRPTPQMVREALFSILGDAIPDRPFIDLFAGTGIVGLEAFSRGASHVRLIERDAKQASEIQRAIVGFGIGKQVQCLNGDVFRWADTWRPTTEAVNLFLSPPFPDLAGEPLERFFQLVNTLWAKLPADSVLTLQVETGFPTERLPEQTDWDMRQYGRNMLLIRVKPAVESASPTQDEPQS